MPQISNFFGIIIMMFYDEHNPPHFHAKYAEYMASISINDFLLLEGSLPPRVLGLVVEWAALHQAELLSNWKKAKEMLELDKISPLQ